MANDFEQVKEFHVAFDCPAPDSPTILTEDQVINRATWIVEEQLEIIHATAGNEDKFKLMFLRFLSRLENTYKKQLNKPYPENVLTAQVDGYADSIYFSNGGFVELGVDPSGIIPIVHSANMSKLWDDGKPHYENGKVVKPEGWTAPEPLIEDEIKRQLNK
jgi:predicted HAD superfamily Cof-like phosphohydrolase